MPIHKSMHMSILKSIHMHIHKSMHMFVDMSIHILSGCEVSRLLRASLRFLRPGLCLMYGDISHRNTRLDFLNEIRVNVKANHKISDIRMRM